MGQSSSTGKVAKVAQYNPKYEVIREVSDPNYGKVKLIRLQTPDRTQMILKEFVYDNKKAYETEAEFFQNRVAFDHPNVVRVIGYNSRNEQNLCSNFYRVSVFIEILVRDLNSDIQDHKMNQTQYTENDILLLAENLLNALSFLQKNHIAHGDIRPLNVFVQDDRFKLTDPKLEVDKSSDAYLKAVLNKSKTLLSPELLAKVPTEKLQHDDVDKYKADVFSLGITLLSVATLTDPEDLYNYSNGTLNENLLHERLHQVQQTRSDFTFHLIESMVRLHEQDRPDFVALNGIIAPHAEEIRNRELDFLGHAGTREISHVHTQERGQEVRKKAAHQSKPLSSQELPHEEEDAFGSERTQEKVSDHHHQTSNFHHMSSLVHHGHTHHHDHDHDHHHHHHGHVHSANNVDTDDLELQIQRALQRSRDTYQQVYGTQAVSQKLGISAGHTDIRTQTFGPTAERGTSGAQFSFGNANNTQESAHEAHHHVTNIANPFYTEGVKSHTITSDIRAREEADRVVRSAASQGHARHASAQIPVTTTTTPIVNTDHEAIIQEILRKYQQPAVSTTTYSTEGFKPASYTTTGYASENIKRSGIHDYTAGGLASTFPEPAYNKHTSQIEYTTSTFQPDAGRSAEVERILRSSNVGGGVAGTTGTTSYEYSIPKTSYTTTTHTTGGLEGSPAGLKQSRSKYSRPEDLTAGTSGVETQNYHYTSTGYTGPSAGVQELLAELKRKEDLRKSGAGETAGYTYTSYSTKTVPTTVVSTTVNGGGVHVEPTSYGQTSQVRSVRNPGEVLAEAGSALSKYSADGVTVHEEQQ